MTARAREALSQVDDRAVVAAFDRLAGRRVLVVDDPGEVVLALAAAGASVTLLARPDLAAVARVKVEAARRLPLASTRSFLGLGHFGRRVWFYHHLRPGLPEPVRRWWDAREDWVREGLLAGGERERRVAAVRRVLRAVDLDAARRAGEAGARERWWQARGPVGRLGLGGVVWAGAELDARPSVPALLARVGEVLRAHPLERSLLLEWAWTGGWADPAGGPAWLSPELYPAAVEGAERVVFVEGPLPAVLARGGWEGVVWATPGVGPGAPSVPGVPTVRWAPLGAAPSAPSDRTLLGVRIVEVS